MLTDAKTIPNTIALNQWEQELSNEKYYGTGTNIIFDKNSKERVGNIEAAQQIKSMSDTYSHLSKQIGEDRLNKIYKDY